MSLQQLRVLNALQRKLPESELGHIKMAEPSVRLSGVGCCGHPGGERGFGATVARNLRAKQWPAPPLGPPPEPATPVARPSRQLPGAI